MEKTQREPSRIRYADDVETGRPRRQLRHRDSDASSMRSGISGRHVIDPDVILPVQFRTLSYTVEDHQNRDLGKTPTDSETAAIIGLDWHILSPEKASEQLNTSLKLGLSTSNVPKLQKQYGKNTLSPPPSIWVRKTIKHLFGGFGFILLVAAVLVFIAWKPLGNPHPAIANLALAIVLLIVFAIQAFFSFYQDWSTSRVMASIKNMLPDECIVIRDGTPTRVMGPDIVPGDILQIKMGDKLPADVRFIQVSPDARYDRAILTGETVPLRATLNSTDNNFLETACIGLAGTHCVAGTSTGIVVATGDNSVFGKLAKLTNRPKGGITTLEKEIYYFVACIVSIMVSMIILVVIVWTTWLNKDHHGWINVPSLIVACVSVAVAFIPEGLPIAVTASLTITAKVMKRNKILCKSLKTVETLGSVSVICSDKTGTLTINRMTVTDCMVGSEPMSANSVAGIVELNNVSSDKHDMMAVSYKEMACAGSLCNAAEIDAATLNLPVEHMRIMGDATDQAILRFAEAIGSSTTTRQAWKTVFRIPFNSKDKYMVHVAEPSVTRNSTTNASRERSMTLFIKGAPDILLTKCSTYMGSNGRSAELDALQLAIIDNVKDAWSREAKRVILVARKALSKHLNFMDPQSLEFENAIADQSGQDLELVGMLAMIDPPREEIPDVVRTLRGAGIRVHMVTGDFKLTAQAIAVQCGIITQSSERIDDISALSEFESSWPDSESQEKQASRSIKAESLHRSMVISGADLRNLNEHQWNVLCSYEEIVFARTTPEQKLRIVKELQARGETVGMTGDGVNDAPSLKAADIGIAMGGGSDIAIEAADMVLLDSFAGIVEAVRYGRVVFDNLKKTICYLLPAGSFSEFWPVLTNVVFGLPQILSSFLMIIICCCTDCAAATAIAYEKPEADVLTRPPRNPKKDKLVNWKLILHAYGFIGVLETTASFAMSYWFLQRNGVSFSTLWFGFGTKPAGMSDAEYENLLNHASSIYFVNLVVMQAFVLLAVRTRRLSLFSHPPLFRKTTRNLFLFPSVLFAIAIAFFFNYIPEFQRKLDTATVPVAHWFLPVGFGVAIVMLDETRKWVVRRWPKGLVARISW